MHRAERAPHYRGDLRQTALPEMLAIIDRTRVTGVVRAVHGQFTKSIDLDDGYVVHATSSDIGDSLGSFLRRSGQLDEAQFHAVMQRRAEGNARLGEVLIDLGLLTPAQVYQAIREHIEGILWSLFSWEEGEVTFALGALDPIVRAELQGELARLFARLGKTVVLVTHDVREAARLGHAITLLTAGRVVQQGTFADLVERPAAPFVTEFLTAQMLGPARARPGG